MVRFEGRRVSQLASTSSHISSNLKLTGIGVELQVCVSALFVLPKGQGRSHQSGRTAV